MSKRTVTISLGAALESSTGLEPFQHIHGAMRLEIGGREVPYMGYFGPKDVCLNGWINVLLSVIAAFRAGQSQYVFDEGEQGQPAYRFDREGETGYLSIVNSTFSDGEADPEFQRVAFQWRDLEPALSEFGAVLLERVRAHAPPQVEHWRRILETRR
jgi:hypothetical protein